MKRIHLFEIEDQSWCPHIIRTYVTDFLSTVARLTQVTKPTATVLRQVLDKYPEKQIVVLGAGSGGGILDVAPDLPHDTKIILTDLYPRQSVEIIDQRIIYLSQSVDAASVPADLKGIRVMYNFFHHLKPDIAKQTLQNAVQEKQPIVVFEATERSLKGLLVCLLIPILVLILTPFVRPFRISRLLLTYILPILPIVIFFDGLVSALRTYSVDEIKDLTKDLHEFSWDIQILKGPKSERIFSLVGLPRNNLIP